MRLQLTYSDATGQMLTTNIQDTTASTPPALLSVSLLFFYYYYILMCVSVCVCTRSCTYIHTET